LAWALIFVAAFGIALLGLYAWARANSSVTLLDRTDSLLGGSIAAQKVSYGADPQQYLLAYGSSGTIAKPILVFFHGGSWESGAPDGYGFIARLAAQEGYVAVSVGYRLGKEGRFPAMLEDGAAAIAWVHRHAHEFGGDPERIVLMGHSAGAYNAAMLALDRQWLGREGLDQHIIAGVIGLAGPYDFYPFDKDSTRKAFGDWPRPEATQPIAFARGDAPPFLLAHGTADITVRPRNSEALAAALGNAGASVSSVSFDGVDHVGILVSLAKPFAWWDSRSKSAVLGFLREIRQSALASAPVQP